MSKRSSSWKTCSPPPLPGAIVQSKAASGAGGGDHVLPVNSVRSDCSGDRGEFPLEQPVIRHRSLESTVDRPLALAADCGGLCFLHGPRWPVNANSMVNLYSIFQMVEEDGWLIPMRQQTFSSYISDLAPGNCRTSYTS